MIDGRYDPALLQLLAGPAEDHPPARPGRLMRALRMSLAFVWPVSRASSQATGD